MSSHFSRPSQGPQHRLADAQGPSLWALRRTPGAWKLLAGVCVPLLQPFQLILLMPPCHPLAVPGLCSAMRRDECHGAEMFWFVFFFITHFFL